MKALVIYDVTGRIWNIIYGQEELPQGLTCMFVDIPDGAILQSIDVTNPDDPQPVFSYLPESDIGKLQKQMAAVEETTTQLEAKTDSLSRIIDPSIDVETCALDELKNYTQNHNKEALANYLANNPLLWTDGEYYGVTQEDQIEMQTDLNAYQIKIASDPDWKLEWHNVKKACKEFTLEDFKQLLSDIIDYVYPLRRHQEAIKEAIYNAATKDEVTAIEIDYSSVSDESATE